MSPITEADRHYPPDARSMATSGRGSGTVGYNVQAAVDTEPHLIVTHEVTNVGHDRAQLSPMAKQTKATLEVDELDDRRGNGGADREWRRLHGRYCTFRSGAARATGGADGGSLGHQAAPVGLKQRSIRSVRLGV